MKIPISWICLLLVVITPIVLSKNDWDWMDCHAGSYNDTGPVGTDHCDCDPNWGGVDCSLCIDDKVCKSGDTCDKSLVISDYKAFNCSPITTGFIPPGSVSAQWTFNGDVGSGVVSVFIHPTGAPFLFNCSFTECSKTVDLSSNKMTVNCPTTNCYCSTWCNTIVSGIISKMKTQASFTCDLAADQCTIAQNELPLVINLQCTASSCQQGPYTPPPPLLNTLDIVLISVGGALFLGLVIGGIIMAVIIARRRDRARPIYQPLHEDMSLTLSFHNVTCKIGKRTVLNGISGAAQPGQVMAILGPSGAGKTTFLDILAGRKNTGQVGGEILLNGQPRDKKSWKRISGYVLQDERMLGTLTVREHLTVVSQLRLPSYMPDHQKATKVEEVMEELGISHIADSKIGTITTRGISGGERKRLAIASELITDPPILFLDEPTSGLDSYNAFTLMETLKHLCQEKKRTVVVSIHQPRSNIFTLFDSLMLLSYGELVYFGPAPEALNHFGSLGYECPRNFNPADYLIDMVTMNSEGLVRNLAQRYRDSFIAHNMVSTLDSIQSAGNPLVLSKEYEQEYASSFFKQFWILSKRTVVNNLRNPYLVRFQYVVTIALSVLIGGIYFHVGNDIAGVQDRAGCLFFMVCLLSFGSMSSIDTFFEERPIFLRERANGMYRTSSYFLAKAFCDVLPMRIIPPVMMGSITYWMIGLHEGVDHYGWFVLTLVLVSLVAGCMCLAISASIPSLSLGNLVAILLMLFYMLFGGFLLNKDSIPPVLRWLKYLSFLQYGFEVLMVNELNNLEVLFNPQNYPAVEVNGRQFLIEFNMDPDRFYTDLVVLAGMVGVYLSVAYLLLRFATKERR